MRVEIAGVSIAIGDVPICQNINLNVPNGQVVGIVGPNGSGKSTLLRSVYRVLRPIAGIVAVGEDDVWQLSPRESARRTAVVAQEPQVDFEFTVLEVVQLGRAPHKGLFDRDSAHDLDIVMEALTRVGMASFIQQPYGQLSGGEKQRVLIARALAQQAQVLVLDEPTNHLDIRYQLEILQLVRSLTVTTLIAIHDLNLAATYCDHLLVMQRGEAVAGGHPDAVLQPDLLRAVFEIEVTVGRLKPGGRRMLAFALPSETALPATQAIRFEIGSVE